MGRAPFRTLNYTIETFQGSILHDFQEKAQESLLFIRLSQITAKRRAPAQPCKFLWSVDVQRTAVEVSGYAASRLTVSTQASNTPRGSAKWLVVTNALSAAEVPDSVRTNGEKKSVKLGLAAPLDEEHSFHAKFFSMLPLAIPVALPVHVNASFKMSSDRRQIRMDAYDNDDTRFNRWLLTDQLPQLYLAQLELLALEGRKGNARWWPGVSLKTEVVVRDGNEEEDAENDMPDSLASTLIEHFYKNSLPHSIRPVCCPTYPGQALQFPEAIFYPSYSRPALSPAVKKVLDELQPRMLVTLPVVKKNAGICGAAVAGPDFIKQLLKDGSNAKAIRERLTGDSEMSDLLRYLATPDPAHLEGLQLLQLEDRTWVTFGTTTATRAVYRWPAAGQYVRNGVFRGDRFVHLDTFPLELSNGPLGSVNVQTLTAAAVKELAEDQIDRLRADSEAMGKWVDKFWQAYPTFPPADGLPKAVETLPLVPTMGGTTFKSLLQVKNVEVLLTSGLEEEWLRDCFQDLGIPVVDQRNFAVTLTELLRYGEYGPTEPTVFGSFLRAVSSISSSPLHRLRHWPPQRQQDFAAWARRNILTKPEKHLKAAQGLPIWRSRKGAALTLRSANDVRLLPLGVSLEVGRFCQNFVTDERSLLYLDKETMTVQQLYGILRFDTLQAGDDENVYRVFFQQHLLHSSAVEKPLVPNTAREMVAPDTLFEHSNFFDAAFGTTSPNFLLPSFNEFGRHLPLKRDDGVRINLFKQCAKALQDANDPNKIDRGRIVYQKYHTFLPLHIISEDKWQQLDDIRFIPRDRATTRPYLGHEIELPQHIRDLPPLISPSKVVIAKYYPVAWTQRARLEVEPEPRLAMVYPDFGRPSGEQVVCCFIDGLFLH
jgi:sacsin